MKTFTLTLAAAFVACSAVAAHAGGWGSSSNYTHVGHNQTSTGGLINVAPSIGVGNIGVLNGILNNSAILSGNNVANGNLSGNGVGILGTGILSNQFLKIGRK